MDWEKDEDKCLCCNMCDGATYEQEFEICQVGAVIKKNGRK